jgi:hypothetical protein
MIKKIQEFRRLIMKRPKTAVTVAVLAVLIPLFFQNCAEVLDPTQETGLASVTESAPFAFESSIDQIAYMSCSNMPAGYDPKAFFTFKAGAYGPTAGVRLTNSFNYAVRNLSQSDKATALANSKANKDATLQLSLRQSSNLQHIFSRGNVTSYSADFFGTLTQTGVASPLLADRGVNYLKSFPSLGAAGEFADTIHFTASETDANDVRNELNVNNNLLAFTYNRAGSGPGLALGPTENSPTSVYGSGFLVRHTLGFGQASDFSSGPFRVLSSLTEYNLLTGQPNGRTWDCPASWRFMIVRTEDLGVNAACPNTDQEPVPTNEQTEAYQVLRRMLPASDWGVNLYGNCIVPKRTGLCYGNTAATINYQGGTCNPLTGTCPHYVSLCRRR